MMKFKHYLNEEYETTVSQYGGRGKEVEIFKNPTSKELREIDPNKNGVRAFLLPNGKDCIAWRAIDIVHHSVREEMKLHKDSLPVILWIVGGSVGVMVTDNAKRGKWFHNPKIYDFIMKHKYLKKWTIDEISYFDEAIVGKWHEEY